MQWACNVSCALENRLKLGFGKETYLYLKESLIL